MAIQSIHSSSTTSGADSTSTSTSDPNDDSQSISNVPILPVFLVAGLFVAGCIVLMTWRRLRANQILLYRMNLAAPNADAERLEYSLQHEPVLWDVKVTNEGPGRNYEDYTVKDSDVGTWKAILPLSASFILPASPSTADVDRVDPYYDLPPDPVTQIPAYIRQWLTRRRQRRRPAEEPEVEPKASPLKDIPADTLTEVTVVIAMPSQHSRSNTHSHSYSNHPLEASTSEPESSAQGASTSYRVEKAHDSAEGVPFEYCLGTTVVRLTGVPFPPQASVRERRSRSLNLHRTRS